MIANTLRLWTIDFEPANKKKGWWSGFYWRFRLGRYPAPTIECGARWREFLHFALSAYHDEEEWHLNIQALGLFVYLPLPFKVTRQPADMMDRWGVKFWGDAVVPDTFWFDWGPNLKWHKWMPWMWDHHKHEIFREDGTWGVADERWSSDPEDGRKIESYPYRYVCRSGEIQDVTATVHVSRRTWRWQGLKWLPWPRRIETSLEIQFSESVGEGRGSWKGGCIGCGWEINPGETPEEALRRMESTRKFSR